MNKPPEQEAEELIQKHFIAVCPQSRVRSEVARNLYTPIAKQCALITVDLVLKALPMYTGDLNPKWEHYQKVRAAIEAKT